MALKTDIAVLGAGLSGLYAALQIAKSGKKVLVLECEDFPGGIARSNRFGENLYDFGLQFLRNSDPEIFAEVDRIYGDELISVEPDHRIRLNGEDFPLSEMGRGLSLMTKVGGGLGLIGAKLTDSAFGKDPKNAEQALKKLYGGTLVKGFFKQEVESFWGRELGDLSPDCVSQQIARLETFDSLRNGLSKLGLPEPDGKLRPAEKPDEMAYYSTTGGETLSRVLVQELEKAGGRVVYSAEVTGLEVDDGRITTIKCQDLTSDPEEPEFQTIECAGAISTIPIRSLVKALGSHAPAQVHASSLHLNYRGAVIFGCLVRRDKVLEGLSLKFRDRLFHRISEPKNAGMGVRPTDHTILQIEATSEPGQPLWEDDERTWVNIFEDLEAEKIIKRDEIAERHHYRSANAYPIFKKEYEEHRERFFGFLTRFSNFECAGATGAFRAMDLLGAMRDGKEAAQRVLSAVS